MSLSCAECSDPPCSVCLCVCVCHQPVPSIGRSSLSLIQLTNSNPGHGPYQRPQYHNSGPMGHNMGGNRGPRPLDQVTCYKVSQAPLLCPRSSC